jgi:hypothetical protein
MRSVVASPIVRLFMLTLAVVVFLLILPLLFSPLLNRFDPDSVAFSRATFLTEYFKLVGTFTAAVFGFFVADRLLALRKQDERKVLSRRSVTLPAELLSTAGYIRQKQAEGDTVGLASALSHFEVLVSEMEATITMSPPLWPPPAIFSASMLIRRLANHGREIRTPSGSISGTALSDIEQVANELAALVKEIT